MRETYHRCVHCRVLYLYEISGYTNNIGDDRYCNDCKKVINEALSKVPKKVERIWVKTDEVTLETLLKWEKEFEEKQLARRISFPLFNMETGKSDRSGFVVGRGGLSGHKYHYRFWPGKESEAIIEVEMEKDLQTGKLMYW